MGKNKVGRPSNETIRKRNITRAILIILIAIIIGMVAFILNEKGVFSNKDSSNKSNDVVDKTNNQGISITYKTDKYETKDKKGNVVTSNERNLPVITNIDESVANKIVNSLTEISNKEWEEILSSANDIDSEQQENTNLGVKFIISTDYISENFVSFRSELSGGFGGVGWSNTDLYIYNLKTGNKLEIKDIASDENGLKEEIKKYISEKVVSKVECLNDNWTELLDDNILKSWNITKTGMNIIIPRYQIACGSAGAIEVNIPFSNINKYLNDEYKK